MRSIPSVSSYQCIKIDACNVLLFVPWDDCLKEAVSDLD